MAGETIREWHRQNSMKMPAIQSSGYRLFSDRVLEGWEPVLLIENQSIDELPTQQTGAIRLGNLPLDQVSIETRKAAVVQPPYYKIYHQDAPLNPPDRSQALYKTVPVLEVVPIKATPKRQTKALKSLHHQKPVNRPATILIDQHNTLTLTRISCLDTEKLVEHWVEYFYQNTGCYPSIIYLSKQRYCTLKDCGYRTYGVFIPYEVMPSVYHVDICLKRYYAQVSLWQ